MHAHEFTGLAVIAAAEGERLGTVSRMYFDPGARSIIGFAVDAGQGFFQPDISPRVDMSQVQSVGPDAVIVGSKSDARGDQTDERFPDLVEIDELIGRPMLTTTGESLGKVTRLRFDNQTFALTEIEISSGRVTRRIEDVVDFGGDYLMVANGAGDSDAGEESGQGVSSRANDATANRGPLKSDKTDA
jgi:uncharacterized protein YrrD